MKTIAAPATRTLSKVNVSYIQRGVFQVFQGFRIGYIVWTTSFAMEHICKNASFQADPIEVHDETFGDATWHIYRPVAA